LGEQEGLQGLYLGLLPLSKQSIKKIRIQDGTYLLSLKTTAKIQKKDSQELTFISFPDPLQNFEFAIDST
jgi:6-phosphofructokinase